MAVGADLEAIGDAMVDDLPPVDLVASVMGRVEQLKLTEAEDPPSNVVPLKRPEAAKRLQGVRWLWPAAGAGVAVAAMLLLWVSGYRVTRLGDPPQVPQVAQAPDPEAVEAPELHVAAAPTQETAIARTAFDEAKSQLPDFAALPRWNGNGAANGGVASVEPLSIDDVLAARRAAITDPESRSQIAQWASLTEDKARALVASANASLDAKVAAAEALSAEEAQPVLLAAAQAVPDNPYLRYRLASSYGEQDTPEASVEAIAQLEVASELDPDNALAQYRLAAELFKQGDTQASLAALADAATMTGVNVYTAEAAAYQEQAMVESGLDPSVARLLAAFTAGSQQYTDLVDLGTQLLQFGRDQEALGDMAAAQQVYEAVYGMGTQVYADAAFSAEQLAGLDIQHAATDALAGFFEFLNMPEDIAALTERTLELVQAFGGIGEIFGQLDDLFQQALNSEFLMTIADVILGQGDLNLFDNLPENGSGA
ncbi:MAG: hypothetical protein GWP08_20155 [Nitrospiraceae bacterium]|nr:hypothetical protein [Nitrospiraceae bacterium]